MSDHHNHDNKKEEEKTVILEDEKEIVLDHDYDGIKELDHPLPSWWTATFIGGIIFAILYTLYYHFLGGASIQESYDSRMAQIQEKRAHYLEQMGGFDLSVYQIHLAESMELGQEVYDMNCMACHGVYGEGDIGSNLTNDYWKQVDGTAAGIFEIVLNGRLDVGMPGWSDILSSEKIYAVTAYVRSLRGSNPDNALPDDGEFFAPPPPNE